MADGDLFERSPLIPRGSAGVEYHGRRYTLQPRAHHAWAVLDRQRCVGFVELAHPHIGDPGPRFAAKPVEQERTIVEGWTDDWRLAVEWLIDQQEAGRSRRTGHRS